MPKFKKGDRFQVKGGSEGTIISVVQEDGETWYALRIDGHASLGIQYASYGDKAWEPLPRHEVGDIWLSADLKMAFMVIPSPPGQSDVVYMERITGGPRGYNNTSHVGFYEGKYGPLVKWEQYHKPSLKSDYDDE